MKPSEKGTVCKALCVGAVLDQSHASASSLLQTVAPTCAWRRRRVLQCGVPCVCVCVCVCVECVWLCVCEYLSFHCVCVFCVCVCV